jgi:hypothetical protein
MADVVLFEGETRFVRFPVTASADPLADTVEIAFIGEGAEPVVGDWQTAEWVAGQTWAAGQLVYAGVEIGPADLALAPGTYCAVLRIVGAPPDEPWIPAGTVRIRAAIAGSVLRDLRAEVGGSPADDELADLYQTVHSVPAAALAILRPRLADAITAAAGGGVTIPGVIGVTAPSQPTLLAQQISRLEAQLAAENGDVDTSGLGATSVIAGRFDRVR